MRRHQLLRARGTGWSPGDRPAPAPAGSTTDFGVGAFLPAGTEVARLTR